MTAEKDKKLYEQLEKELQEAIITVTSANTSHVYARNSGTRDQPIASLVIPNKLYLLWDKKKDLQRKQGIAISELLRLCNDSIGGEKKLKDVVSVKERLRKQSIRFLKDYRSKKHGSSFRKSLLDGETNMLVFAGEITTVQAELNSESNKLKLPGKKYEEVGTRQQQRKKNAIINSLKDHCENLPHSGLELTSVQLRTTGSHETISLQIEQINQPSSASEENKEDKENIPQICQLMLQYGVSDQFYHELSSIIKELPRSYKIKEFRNELPIPTIKKTPGEFEGAQFDFKELLELQIKEEVEEHADYYQDHCNICIKISADGAKYSRKSNYCLISFSFIKEGQCNLSCRDIHSIGAIKADESYSNLSTAFINIFNDINSYIRHPQVTINEVDYTLEFFLSADYKLLLMLMGMKQATSNYACLWCTIHKDDRYNMEITIPSDDPEVKLRKLQDLKGDGNFSCVNLPLLNIELDHVIPDELHLMLRITDVLIEAAINTVLAYDHHQHQIQQSGRRRTIFNPLHGAMLQNLLTAINSCGVQFRIWKEKNGTKLDWTSLMGPDKLKLLKRLPDKLNTCHPESMILDVQTLWKDFDGIYTNIQSSSLSNSHDLHQRGIDWVNHFLKLADYPYSDGYQPNKVTPYMHIMVHHVPTYIEKHNSIKQFSAQGIEKNNDVAKTIFFKNSNKWDAATDILRNQHRLSQLKNCKRRKRNYEKCNETYWSQGGIQESRSKRPRISHSNTIYTSSISETV